MGLSWGVFTNRKSDVQGRLLDLSWGEGEGVQDGRVGLSWGVFTNRKSDVQGRLLDLSWGGGGGGGRGRVSRVDVWVCLGGSSRIEKVMSRVHFWICPGGREGGV